MCDDDDRTYTELVDELAKVGRKPLDIARSVRAVLRAATAQIHRHAVRSRT
jgi:hypothetical protein